MIKIYPPAIEGVPEGGTTGQVLAKATDVNFDTHWVTGGGGITNGAGANVITKSNGTNLVASRITDDATTITATTAQLQMGVFSGGSYRTQILLNNTTAKVSLGDVTYVGQGNVIIVDDDTRLTSLGDVNDLGNGISIAIDDDDELVAIGDVRQYQHEIYSDPAKSGMQLIVDNGNEVIQFGQLTAKLGGAIVKLDSASKLVTVSFVETPPATHIVAATGAGGTNLLTAGAYQWRVTFVTSGGETTGGASISNAIAVNPATQLGPALSSIPLGDINCTARKVYRTVANGLVFKYVATIANNSATTYTDNTADASLGADIPTTNTAIDATLGVTPTGLELKGQAVTIGANDSGGAGFRLLRVPNV